MSKAVSWTNAGAGFDAREAARDAARRQGKSLGEWLHGVIADDVGERIEAVTARLERLSTGSASERAPIGPREAPSSIGKSPGAPHGQPDQATRAADERAEVRGLAEQLAEIDARLSSRDETPIRATLARLEARLEQIGRRGEIQTSLPAPLDPRTSTGPKQDAESIRRREATLNAVRAAIAEPADAAPIALAGARDWHEPSPIGLPMRRRRLGEAIADIAERQRALDAAGSQRGAAAAPRAQAVEITAEGGPLSARLDDIRRAMTASSASPQAPHIEADALRRDIAAITERLRDVAPRDAIAAMDERITQLSQRLDSGEDRATRAAIDELRVEMRTIGDRVAQVQEVAARPSSPDLSTLERLVRDLSARLDTVQAPSVDAQAIDALQHEIGTLASRLATTETGLASLASLDHSMRDLFAHLEETRSFAETVAARAAGDAVRTALAETGLDHVAPHADMAELRAMQEAADCRTRATLGIVHAALDKVVGRLDAVEHGLVEARAAGATRDEAAPRWEGGDTTASRLTPLAPDLQLAATEPLGVSPPLRAPVPVDAAAAQSDFIAAARRAANAAQSDPTVVAMRRPAVPLADAVTRAGLAARSRDYVATHKRPVLLAMAAVLVVAATVALVPRPPFGGAGREVAASSAPGKIAAVVASAQPKPADLRQAAVAPRPAPAIVTPGSGNDPIVTGSIPSLPSFAARTPGAATPSAQMAPHLPAGLTAAADGGDGAAQFTLASAYAEGRAVPRDFSRAAKLYAKAADQGIVPARYRLGALYEKGLGVSQDKAHARSLYQQAADAGSPRAMHNLAVLLADGDGKPDYEAAATWFRRAAQLGVHDSQFNLAILLARGLGVEPSLVQSYQWFAIAATQGDADAAGKRDEVASKLSASELSVAKALVAAFHPRAPDPAAVDVTPPSGGWDGAPAPLHLNSARSKISSL